MMEKVRRLLSCFNFTCGHGLWSIERSKAAGACNEDSRESAREKIKRISEGK